MRLVSYLIQLLFFAYLVPFAWKYVKAGMASGQLSPACGIPMYLIQSFTVISFVLCCIRLIQKFIQRVEIITGKKRSGGEIKNVTISSIYIILCIFINSDSYLCITWSGCSITGSI